MLFCHLLTAQTETNRHISLNLKTHFSSLQYNTMVCIETCQHRMNIHCSICLTDWCIIYCQRINVVFFLFQDQLEGIIAPKKWSTHYNSHYINPHTLFSFVCTWQWFTRFSSFVQCCMPVHEKQHCRHQMPTANCGGKKEQMQVHLCRFDMSY